MRSIETLARPSTNARTTSNVVNIKPIGCGTGLESGTLLAGRAIGEGTGHKMAVGLDGNLVLEDDTTSPGGGGRVLHAGLPGLTGEDTHVGTLLDLEAVDEGALGALVGGGADGAGLLLVGEAYARGDGGGGGEVGGAGDGGDGCGGE